MENKLYGRGTAFNIVYKHDGIAEKQSCILATCYEEEFLFQVIVVAGYHAGEIDGYIEYQYPQGDSEKRNFCTIEHVEKQLRERIYSEVILINMGEFENITIG